jgi:protease IV
MSDVAASGGYWVSTSADEVLADPATITGSIGVFGLVPTFDKTLEKLGVHTGGVTTTWLAGEPDLRRPLDPRVGQVIQASVGHTYQEFLARAAASRHASAEQIEEVAQGRVCTGRQARERRLVDGFGGLMAAIHDAAQQAKLGPGFRTAYIELEPKGLTRLLDLLAEQVAHAALRIMGPLPGRLLLSTDLSTRVGTDLKTVLLGRVTPPQVLAHCLCQAPP